MTSNLFESTLREWDKNYIKTGPRPRQSKEDKAALKSMEDLLWGLQCGDVSMKEGYEKLVAMGKSEAEAAKIIEKFGKI